MYMLKIFRYWTEKGICWARNSEFQEIDDTAMGFRMLRLHGYEVSPSKFQITSYTTENKIIKYLCLFHS